MQADVDVRSRPRAGCHVREEARKLRILGINILAGTKDALVVGPRLREVQFLLEEPDFVGVDRLGIDRVAVALLRGVCAHGGAGDPVLRDFLFLGLIFHLDLHHIAVGHAVPVRDKRQLDRAIRTENRLPAPVTRDSATRDVAVRHDRTVLQLLPARVLEYELDVVVDVAAVLPVVKPSDSHDRLRVLVEDPVRNVDLVRHQLGAQAAGVLAIEAPVELILEVGLRLAAPVGVPVPLSLDVGNVTDHAGVHHLLGALVEEAVASLEPDLDDLVGIGFVQRPETVDFFGAENERLLAEDVLARFQGRLHHGIVQEQRDRDEHGLDVVAREQFVVVGVGPRLIVEDLEGSIEVLLVNVAERNALAVRHIDEVSLEQPPATAAGTDHGVVNDFLGLCLRRTDERALRRCRDRRSGGGCGLGEIAPVKLRTVRCSVCHLPS